MSQTIRIYSTKSLPNRRVSEEEAAAWVNPAAQLYICMGRTEDEQEAAVLKAVNRLQLMLFLGTLFSGHDSDESKTGLQDLIAFVLWFHDWFYVS